MSFCAKCGVALEMDSGFCSACGAPARRASSQSDGQTSTANQSSSGLTKGRSPPAPEASTQAGAKPLGLVLVAIYTAISAVLMTLGGVVGMFASAVAGEAGAALAVFGLVSLLAGVLAFAATYGLWFLVSWGHSSARILYIAYIPLGLLSILPDRTAGNVILQLVGVALSVWILTYLAKSEVKSLFGQEGVNIEEHAASQVIHIIETLVKQGSVPAQAASHMATKASNPEPAVEETTVTSQQATRSPMAAAIVAFCPQCGTKNTDASAVCKNCGTALV